MDSVVRVTARRGEGWRDTASGPLCHFPGLCAILNRQARVDSLKSWMRGFFIVLRSLSLKMPSNGLWSVETSKSVQPRVNIRECSRLQAIAKASPSVGLYRVSASLVKRDPASRTS